MNKEELIAKWLDHSLTQQELEQFKKLPEYEQYVKLDTYASRFAAPAFDQEALYKSIQKAKGKNNDIKPMIYKAVAAVIVLLIGTYVSLQLFTNKTTVVTTAIAQQQSVTLPDDSEVILNAESKLSFNPERWEENRSVNLEGEAFFKVQKGQSFEVLTAQGKIRVLGTQFNVKARPEVFSVQTYEGLVGVSHPKYTGELAKGEGMHIIENAFQVAPVSPAIDVPSWTKKNSTFESVPFYMVLKELERQYEVRIVADTIETQKLFTGNFVHTDIHQALQMITLPMQLSYTIDGTLITLTSN